MFKNKKDEETVEVSVASEKAEAIGGVLIAVFAALMAIAQLVNGELEEEMMIAHNKVVNYSNWYQSKTIKESLKESEVDYLQTLMNTDMISEDKRPMVNSKIAETTQKIAKYAAEKKELLLGSANIPEKEWAQDIDGEMGVITGLKEWEQLAEDYDNATKMFDLGLLFFQISIVLGAVCIILYDNPLLQKTFIVLMIVFGIIGIAFSAYGYLTAP